MIREKSAGAVVFHRGEPIEYLLLFSNYWGFAKGRIELGENEETAAVREVQEETGLTVDLIPGFREVDTYWFRYKGELVNKQSVYFLAQARHRNARLSHEHTDLIWLPFEQALERLNYEGGKNILRKANEFILGNLK
jgi:8-oxo-dGTP pyrophosphatase MutT (NUDIX family)